ncbi:MAG TPA: BON domain-containing protein [Flavitalea sp.]|nr:BON domain-containing protein [Flavitalea sp.]
MADNNRNRSNQFNQNWDRNNQDDENRNRENYGNTGYDYESQDRNRRTRYGSSSYGESGYGRENQGLYGGGQGNEYGNQSGESYGQGNYGDRFRQQGQGSQQGGSYGNEHRNENDWTRNQGYGYGSGQNQDWQQSRNMNYGSQYGTSGSYEGRSDRGYGAGYGSSGNRGYGGQNYGNQNYGSSGQDRNRDWWDRTKDEVSAWFGDEDAERRRRVDRIQGPYKGKGPKDYQRSEDRIREDVCDRLSDDDNVDASNIQVQIQSNEVILTGTVASREQKRRAEDVVESISGVRNVENRIRVEQSSDSTSETWGNHERPTVIGKNRML